MYQKAVRLKVGMNSYAMLKHLVLSEVWMVVCTRNSFSARDLFQEHLKTCLPKNRVCSFAGRALHLRSFCGIFCF